MHTPALMAHTVVFHFVGENASIDDFAVRTVEGEERLNQPYSFRVEVSARNEEADPLRLLGTSATLTFEHRSHQRVIQGIVERVTVDDRSPLRFATVLLVPALVASRYTTTTRVFQESTALEIVEQVLREDLGRYRRTLDSTSLDRHSFARRDYCVQYRESNLDFVSRLLEEEGVGYYFRPGGSGETLVLFDDNRSLPVAETIEPGPLPVVLSISSGGENERIHRFSSAKALVSGSTTIRDHDWIRGRPTIEATSAAIRWPQEMGECYEHGLGRGVTVYEDAEQLTAMTAGAIAAALPLGMPLEVEHDVLDLPGAMLPPWSDNDAEGQAQRRLERQRRDGATFAGAGNVCGFAPGATFELSERGAPHETGYLLTSVTHRGWSSEGRTGSEPEEAYQNEFECLPTTSPWRPDRRAPKPRISGVQTAQVTGPAGTDVHTDPYGRVKVIFSWDRTGLDVAGERSCWLRVSQPWAGPGAPGFSFIPRIGMEVIVTFVDGDPDRPLVIGCVNNATNPTPGLLPVQATKSVIRTRTVPHGPGHNEISFEDAMGVERVHIRAERDLDELIGNDHVTIVQRDRDLAVSGNYRSYVRRNSSEEIGMALMSRTRGSRTTVTGIHPHERIQVRSPDCFLRSGPRMRPHVTATYVGDPISSAELTTIEGRFEAAIYHHWNGKLILVPRNGTSSPLSCSVVLHFLHDDGTDPHLRVRVIKNPRQRRGPTRRTHSRDPYPRALPFRANCWANSDPAGVDMTLDWNGAGWDVSHTARDAAGNEVSLNQNYLAHEFGHYLGLDHSCHTPASAAVGWCSGVPSGVPDEYCAGTTGPQMDRIMAMGNRVVRENGTAWQQRLVTLHHYKCSEGYAPELVP